jgi:hypothetical protein
MQIFSRKSSLSPKLFLDSLHKHIYKCTQFRFCARKMPFLYFRFIYFLYLCTQEQAR